MGILSGLFRSRDKPVDSTVGSRYAFYMGGSSAGKIVTERSAMQMTAVYACVRILSEAVAGLPLQLYRYNDEGGKEKALDHPLYRLLHDEPNPEMSSFVFRETLMTHLLLWGNASGKVVYEPKGSEPADNVPFKVRVSISDLNIRTGAGTNYSRTQYIPVGVYTIVEVKNGKGSAKGWGRLKSGAGWISLDYATRL